MLVRMHNAQLIICFVFNLHIGSAPKSKSVQGIQSSVPEGATLLLLSNETQFVLLIDFRN